MGLENKVSNFLREGIYDSSLGLFCFLAADYVHNNNILEYLGYGGGVVFVGLAVYNFGCAFRECFKK